MCGHGVRCRNKAMDIRLQSRMHLRTHMGAHTTHTHTHSDNLYTIHILGVVSNVHMQMSFVMRMKQTGWLRVAIKFRKYTKRAIVARFRLRLKTVVYCMRVFLLRDH